MAGDCWWAQQVRLRSGFQRGSRLVTAFCETSYAHIIANLLSSSPTFSALPCCLTNSYFTAGKRKYPFVNVCFQVYCWLRALYLRNHIFFSGHIPLYCCLSTDSTFVQKKWRNIRDNFVKNINRYNEQCLQSGPETVGRPRFSYWKEMRWILPFNKQAA